MRLGTMRTSRTATPRVALWTRWWGAACLLAATAAPLALADTPSAPQMPSASAEAQPATAAPLRQPARSQAPTGHSLDKRIAVFKKALDLDATQVAKLRQILVEQREAVQRVWVDSKLLPAERVPATRAVEERTGDRIRGLLSAEQKLKYNPPKPPAPPAPESGAPSVEAWMQRTRPKL